MIYTNKIYKHITRKYVFQSYALSHWTYSKLPVVSYETYSKSLVVSYET